MWCNIVSTIGALAGFCFLFWLLGPFNAPKSHPKPTTGVTLLDQLKPVSHVCPLPYGEDPFYWYKHNNSKYNPECLIRCNECSQEWVLETLQPALSKKRGHIVQWVTFEDYYDRQLKIPNELDSL